MEDWWRWWWGQPPQHSSGDKMESLRRVVVEHARQCEELLRRQELVDTRIFPLEALLGTTTAGAEIRRRAQVAHTPLRGHAHGLDAALATLPDEMAEATKPPRDVSGF